MQVFDVDTVDEALGRGLHYLQNQGILDESRNGAVLVSPEPITTLYLLPRQRVLYNPKRDANPFFHLLESLWIIHGRQDVAFLKHFNSRISDYSDDGVTFHAPYGWRLRHHFAFDQIEAAIHDLSENPKSRQAVLQIWDADMDLDQTVKTKDKPCNDLVFLSARTGALDIMVANRSNDIVWGAYGANVVQFSVLQEYLAARIGISAGTYEQVSFNYHAYVDNPYFKQVRTDAPNIKTTYPTYTDPYNPEESEGWVTTSIFNKANVFQVQADMIRMFFCFDQRHRFAGEDWVGEFLKEPCKSYVFQHIIGPMLSAHRSYKRGDIPGGIKRLEDALAETGENHDWLCASKQWLERRVK